MGELIAQFRDPKVIDELTKGADIKFVSTDTLDGAPMRVYQYSVSDPQGKGFKVTSKTWVNSTDNLPRKTESEGEMEIMGKQVKTKTTVTYYAYGADIRIAPSM
jgi:hypothetical protein